MKKLVIVCDVLGDLLLVVGGLTLLFVGLVSFNPGGFQSLVLVALGALLVSQGRADQ